MPNLLDFFAEVANDIIDVVTGETFDLDGGGQKGFGAEMGYTVGLRGPIGFVRKGSYHDPESGYTTPDGTFVDTGVFSGGAPAYWADPDHPYWKTNHGYRRDPNLSDAEIIDANTFTVSPFNRDHWEFGVPEPGAGPDPGDFTGTDPTGRPRGAGSFTINGLPVGIPFQAMTPGGAKRTYIIQVFRRKTPKKAKKKPGGVDVMQNARLNRLRRDVEQMQDALMRR
jgi:hypothetical protein